MGLSLGSLIKFSGLNVDLYEVRKYELYKLVELIPR